MKTKVLVLIGILIIAFAAVTVPVSAGTTGTTYLAGNIAKYVSITVSPSSLTLTLDPTSSPATNNLLDIKLSQNTPATVTVADNTGRPAAAQGFMGNYTTTYAQGSTALNTTLASSIALTASSTCVPGAAGTITPVAITPPITSTPANMFTTLGVLNSADCPTNIFSQAVAYTDPVLPSPTNAYRIDFVFTITAN